MRNSDHYIVVEDPAAEYWDGSIVDSRRANILSTRGVVLLPVVPALMRLSGVGGYYKRAWGAGWPLASSPPKMHAPMTIYVVPEYRTVSWAARIMGEDDNRESYQGQIRLAADGSQPHASNTAGVSGAHNTPVDFGKLGPRDEYSGWVIRGEAQILTAGAGGHFGLALYGEGAGLRVVWAAASLTA